MFQNKVLNDALMKATKGNVVDTAMIFALIDGYLNETIVEKNFLNDIKAITQK